MQTKKQILIKMFEMAIESKSNMIFIGLEAVGSKEVIVIPNESFKSKLDFYKGAYDDNLAHVMNDKVGIKSFSYGDLEELKNHI